MQAFLDKHFYLVNLAVFGLVAGLAGLLVTDWIELRLLGDDTPRKRIRRPRVKPRAKPRAPRMLARQSDIRGRNIFCSSCTPKKPSKKKQAPEKPLSLDNAVLLATLISDDEQWTVATIRFPKEHITRLVSVGDRLGKEIEVTGIEAKQVTVRKGDQTGAIKLFREPKKRPRRRRPRKRPRRRRRGNKWHNALARGIRKVGPNKFEIKRSLVSQFMGNAGLAARDASIRPHMHKGKMAGFRLRRLKSRGVFARLGLRRGDVITAINNHGLTSPDKLLTLYTKLPSASHMTISVTRKGKPLTMDYTIR